MNLDELPTHDNSMLSAFRKCPRLYHMQYVLNRKPIDEPLYFGYGSMLHNGMAKFYEAKAAGATIEEAAMKGLEAIESFAYIDDPADFRTKGRATQVFLNYVVRWAQHDWDSWKIILTETPFDIVTDDGFKYSGRIDLVIENNDGIFVVDHKTTAMFGQTYYDRYFPDPQTAGYVWAASHLHNERIAGAMLNVIVTRKNDGDFDRREFIYDQYLIDEWEAQTRNDYLKIVDCYNTNYWSNNGWEHCIDVRFRKRCPMYGVCRVPLDYREKMLFGPFFKDNDWSWHNEGES